MNSDKPALTAEFRLTPDEIEQPYFFDSKLIRKNITEGKPGIPFKLNFTILDYEYNPVKNALVEVFHADRDGTYSGLGNAIGETFLRGIQPSDSDGNAFFDTIFPGNYADKGAFINFVIRVSALNYVTSRIVFPDETAESIQDSSPEKYNQKQNNSGTPGMSFETFNFEPGTMDIIPSASGGFEGYITIIINEQPQEGEPPVYEAGGYSLEQNEPNPFAKSTTITYLLPQSSRVRLSIYDVTGKEIEVMLDERQPEGMHGVSCDMSGKESGFYFYKLNAEEFTAVREMLYLKK